MAARRVSTHRQSQRSDLEDITRDTLEDLFRSSNPNSYFSDAETNDRNSDENPESLQEDDINELMETLRHYYGDTLSENLERISQPVDETPTFDNFFTVLSDQSCEEHTNTETACANCAVKKRVENSKQFKAGQHIRLPGEKYTCRLGKKLVRLYSHHAIIKQVVETNKNTATLILIHFLEKDGVIDIHETTESYNLKEHEITIVQYTRPRYSPEQIISRAERMISQHKEKQFGRFNGVLRNCEHFATWCVVGEGESFQTQNFFGELGLRLSQFTAIGAKIARIVLRVLANTADELASFSNKSLHLPGFVLGGVAAAYLIYCLAVTGKTIYQKQRKQICPQCFRRKIKVLWAKFGVFVGTSGIAYLITHFALPLLCPCVGIPLMILMSVLSFALQLAVPKLIDNLKSPFTCDKIRIKNVSDIKKGDILDIKYWGLHHSIVVCEVNKSVHSKEEGRVLCVHYGSSNGKLHGTREVKEEWMALNTSKTKVLKMDDRFFRPYPPDTVVARARMRVGEIKWSPFNNRSEHLAYFAKVNNDDKDENEEIEDSDTDKNVAAKLVNEDNSENKERVDNNTDKNVKNRSSFYVGQFEVHQRRQLKPGHILKMNDTTCMLLSTSDAREIYSTIKDTERKIEDTERKFDIEILTFYSFMPKTAHAKIDLDVDRLFIKKYLPAQCCSLEERVRRARQSARDASRKCYKTKSSFFESLAVKED